MNEIVAEGPYPWVQYTREDLDAALVDVHLPAMIAKQRVEIHADCFALLRSNLDFWLEEFDVQSDAVAQEIADGLGVNTWRIDHLDKEYIRIFKAPKFDGEEDVTRCVYAIFQSNWCLYVGQTRGLAINRFAKHLQSDTPAGEWFRSARPNFLGYWMVSVPLGGQLIRRTAEAILIKALSPTLNIQHANQRTQVD